MGLKNIIFDLGGVIIDLSVEKTIHEFAKLSGKTPGQIEQTYQQHREFLEYEKGNLTDHQFREFVQRIFNFKASAEEIDLAWNAMLVDLPKSKLDTLLSLKERFKTSVLSNTNNIHLGYINQNMLPDLASFPSLDHYFHVAYYSHQVKKRKPDAEIFMQVISENGFTPAETIMLDDNVDNIKAAANLGLQTKLIESPNQAVGFLKTL